MVALNILQWNCRSIYKKLPEFKHYLSHLPVLPDIICLQETHLTSRYYPNISNYVMIRKDRPRALGKGGGICICVRNTLSFSEIRIPVINSYLEVIGITINDYAIINVYNPPRNIMNILDLGFLSRFRRIILLGDFNSHHTMWGGHSINPSGRSLMSLIETNTSVPTHFTLVGPYVWNNLDLTVVSSSIASHCSISITNEFLGSDRAIIHVAVHGVVPDNTEPLPKWNFSRANWIKFHKRWSSSLNCISLDLEHSYQLSETSILEATRAAIPQTKYTGKIWWNVACDLAIKKKKYALHRMKRARVPLDVIIFKRCRAKARRVILEVKQSSWENFCNALTSNSKLSTVWNVIKKFSGHHPREFIPSLRQGSTTACNNQHKANMLATHFQSVSSTSNYEIAFRRTMSSLEVETLEAASEITLKDPQLNQLFSIDELQCALPTTKNSAPGADQICYKLLKHLPNDSLRVLVHFINSVWATGALPASWCHSIVVPIHKPTKPAHLPSSHRPISLTSAVCKLM